MTGSDRVEILTKESRALTKTQRREIENIASKVGGLDILADYVERGGTIFKARALATFLKRIFGVVDPDKFIVLSKYAEKHKAASRLSNIYDYHIKHHPGLGVWIWETIILKDEAFPWGVQQYDISSHLADEYQKAKLGEV